MSLERPQFAKEVILFAVFFHAHYTVSYREFYEIMAVHGVTRGS